MKQQLPKAKRPLSDFLFLIFITALAIANSGSALSLVGAEWIWGSTGLNTDGTYSAGHITFRRDYSAPVGKTALSASLLVAAADEYELSHNGDTIGGGSSPATAQRYCVPMPLDPSVFAVSARTAGGHAGLLAAVEIQFLDGSRQTLITDAAWRAVDGDDALDVGFDDSAWPAARVEGAFPTTPPWYGQVTIPAEAPPPPLAEAPPPELRDASWIWTQHYREGTSGARAYRKTVVLDDAQYVDSLVLDIGVAAGAYTLYVNGRLVGSGRGGGRAVAQRWRVRFAPVSTVVLSVYAYGRGLLASGVLQGCACGCGEAVGFQSDETWMYRDDVPANFVNADYNDSDWNNAVVEGAYGIAPWGDVPTPTGASLQNGALLGAPAAPTATVVA